MSSFYADKPGAQPRAVPLLSCKHYSYKHAGRKDWILQDISLEVYPGERVLLLGASGSGKSTFLQACAGVLEEGEQSGELRLCGRSPQEERGSAGMVLQDPNSQVILQKLGDDVAFGCENLQVEAGEIWGRVEAAVQEVQLNLPLDRLTQELSGGQKQRMALAGVLAMHPQLLLLDEPTANLDPQGKEDLVAALTRLCENTPDLSLIVVEHQLDSWMDLITRIIVIDDHKIIADGKPYEVLYQKRQELDRAGIWLPGDQQALLESFQEERACLGKPQIAELLQLADKNGAYERVRAGESTCAHVPFILEAQDLTVGYAEEKPVQKGVNLQLKAGASLCIVGENGAGKSTLGLSLAGALKPLAGEVHYCEQAAVLSAQSVQPQDLAMLCAGAHQADKHCSNPFEWKSQDYLGRIAYVFQEPEYQFVCQSVEDELYTSLKTSMLSTEEKKSLVQKTLEELSLSKLAKAHPMSLSGGEKRRLSVATALIHAPKLVILDEPSFGQDKGTWLALIRLLRGLKARGTSLISITHDEAYVCAMADELLELSKPANSPAQEGQEISKESEPQSKAASLNLLSRVNPVFQFLGVLIMTTPLLLTIDPVSALVALAGELLLLPFAGFKLKTLAYRMIPLLLAAPLVALSMLLYAEPAGAIYFTLGPAVISDNSIKLAFSIGLRVIALALPALVVLTQLDAMRMADGLVQILKLPVKPVLASLSGLRMISLMLDDYAALSRAHRLRGVESKNPLARVFKRAFSLLVFALRRSSKLSVAMEARGFGAYPTRTWARPSVVTKASYVYLAICIAIPCIAMAFAILTGEFRPMGR